MPRGFGPDRRELATPVSVGHNAPCPRSLATKLPAPLRRLIVAVARCLCNRLIIEPKLGLLVSTAAGILGGRWHF